MKVLKTESYIIPNTLEGEAYAKSLTDRLDEIKLSYRKNESTVSIVIEVLAYNIEV